MPMTMVGRNLAAFGILFMVVAGYQRRRSKDAAEADVSREKAASLLAGDDVDSGSKSHSSTVVVSESHSPVWEQELSLTRIGIWASLVGLQLPLTIQNWIWWIMRKFVQVNQIPHSFSHFRYSHNSYST